MPEQVKIVEARVASEGAAGVRGVDIDVDVKGSSREGWTVIRKVTEGFAELVQCDPEDPS